MLIVADAGPLNYLVLINQIEVLCHLFGEVVIPEAVLQELTAQKTPDMVRSWAENRPAWATVRRSAPLSSFVDFGQGESEAISLAISLGARLLCDDAVGRQVAIGRGLSVVGTLGI